ncbi:MAG: hypothetical protein Q8M06_04810 [Methanobacteriaceae archaeon]|nr:hypothetical protein [Methanobacteriaceae archaeon]
MSEWVEVKKEEEKKEEIRVWEPVTTGESVQGKYIDLEEDVGQFKSRRYTVRQEDGEIKIWGSTVLDSLMKEVPLNREVRITFNGTQPSKSGRNPWKDYKVEFKPV